MKIVGTRTYLEVRVGRHQSVEVLLHLRRSDVTWFQQNADFLRTELLDLLQASVLPRLFADEMEQNNAVLTKTKLPPKLGPGGIPMTVGEKNKTTTATTTKNGGNNNNNNKRKRGLSKKKQAELKRQREEEERERRKNEKDIYYATGETIRIAYRTEAVSSAGATLLFHEQEEQDDDEDKNSDDDEAASKKRKKKKAKQQGDIRFRALKKLSKRLIIWCYPANAELPASEGFWRPEVIPMASLFRMPASEVAAAAATSGNQQQPVVDLLDD